MLFALGLIEYKSSPVDAMKLFHYSIKELLDILDGFNPNTVEICSTIRKIQIQSNVKDNAIGSFL